jgi:hypothetical protein
MRLSVLSDPSWQPPNHLITFSNQTILSQFLYRSTKCRHPLLQLAGLLCAPVYDNADVHNVQAKPYDAPSFTQHTVLALREGPM